MGECKKALEQTDGDIEAAIQVLRETGIAKAAGKASRAANEGIIVTKISEDRKTAAIIEVNCETDFVAKNETFQAFAAELAEKAIDIADGGLAEAVKDDVAAKISEIGENLIIARNTQYVVADAGAVASYIHLGGKLGIILEFGCNNDANSGSQVLQDLGKEICMHIAALDPKALNRDGMPEDEVTEKALYAKQVEGKPAEIVDKILVVSWKSSTVRTCFSSRAS